MHLWIGILLLGCSLLAQAQPMPDTLWTRTIPGRIPTAMRTTADGGFILCGQTLPVSGNRDGFVQKLNSAGATEWETTLGDAGNDVFNDVRPTHDGGYIAVGQIVPVANRRLIFIVRLDAVGDTLWTRRFGSSESQIAQRVLELDSGFLVAAQTDTASEMGHYGAKLLLLVSANTGDLLETQSAWLNWQCTWGYTANTVAMERGIDGSILVAGNSYVCRRQPHWEYYNHVTKLDRYTPQMDTLRADSSGWGTAEIYVTTIAPQSDNSCLALLTARVIRFDSEGQSVWTHFITETAADFCSGPANGYVTVSSTSGGIVTRAYDDTGALRWQRSYAVDGTASAVAIETMADGGYAILARGNDGTTVLIRTGPDEIPAGSLSLLQAGPPAWGYRLNRTGGHPGNVVFADVCPGTTGRVSGAAAPYFSAVDTAGRMEFRAGQFGSAFATLDTLWLEHPTCGGTVAWSAFGTSGTLPGPFVTAAAPQIAGFTAEPVDTGMVLHLATTAEPHTATLELWRSRDDSSHYQRWTTLSAAGAAHAYTVFDSTVSSGHRYHYRLAGVDSLGYCYDPLAHCSALLHDSVLTAFGVQVSSTAVTLSFTMAREANIATLELWRSAGDTCFFARVATLPALGNAFTGGSYSITDSSAVPEQLYWYMVADVDRWGNRTAHRERLISTLRGFTWVSEFTAQALPNRVTLYITTAFETGFSRFQIQRRVGSEPLRFWYNVPARGHSLDEQHYVQVDSGVARGQHYEYVLSCYDSAGNLLAVPAWHVSVDVPAVDPAAPFSYSLAAYPNPFNTGTRLAFALAERSRVTLAVYDLRGRFVSTVIEQSYDPGLYTVPFDAGGLSSGIYFARLTAGTFTQTQKLLLVR